MRPTEALSVLYADMFVSAFKDIEADGSQPLMRGDIPFNQLYLSGKPTQGSNIIITRFAASLKKFRGAYWGSFASWKDLGVSVLRGERAIPVKSFIFNIYDKETGKPVSMTKEAYDALDIDSKRDYTVRVSVHWTPEFNIDQTDFSVVYPETYKTLIGESVGNVAKQNCSAILRAMEEGTVCEVIVGDNKHPKPEYDESFNRIYMPRMEQFNSQDDFYRAFVRCMVQAVQSEGNLDLHRNDEDMWVRGREEMRTELSCASLCTMLGVDSFISEHNVAYLKAWTEALHKSPMVIYNVLDESVRVQDYLIETLGLTVKESRDLYEAVAEAQGKTKDDLVQSAVASRQKSRSMRSITKFERNGKHTVKRS